MMDTILKPVLRPVLRNVLRGSTSQTPIPPELAMAIKYGGEVFDFRPTDITWQEATGQTLADDAGEGIALALGVGQFGGKTLAEVLAGQPFIPVDFTDGWTTTGAATILGSDQFQTTTSSNGVHKAFLTVGRAYRIVASASTDMTVVNAVGATPVVMTLAGGAASTAVFVASSTSLYFRVSGGGTRVATVSVEIKEIPGSSAIQSGSAGFRPTRIVNVEYDQAKIDAMPELRGGGTIQTAGTGGTASVGSYDPGTGVGTVYRNGGDQSYVRIPGIASTPHRVILQNTGAVTVAFRDGPFGSQVTVPAGQTQTLYFTPGTSEVAVTSGNTSNTAATFVLSSLKQVPADAITNRPGARMDGSDDSLLTPLAPGSAGTLLSKVKMGAGGATRTLIGGPAGSTNRCSLVRTTSGSRLGAGIGSDSSGIITGGGDVSGLTGVAALRWTGSLVKLDWFPQGGTPVQVYSGAQNGAPGADPFRIGATNASGTASTFGNDDHYLDAIYQGALTDAELAEVAASLLAS